MQVLVPELDSHLGAFSVDQFSGRPTAYERHVVARHEKFRSEKRPVGRAEDQYSSRHNAPNLRCFEQHNCAHNKIPRNSGFGVYRLHYNHKKCNFVKSRHFLARGPARFSVSVRGALAATWPASGNARRARCSPSSGWIKSTSALPTCANRATARSPAPRPRCEHSPSRSIIRTTRPQTSISRRAWSTRQCCRASGSELATYCETVPPLRQQRCADLTRRGPYSRPVRRRTGMLPDRENVSVPWPRSR